MAKSITSQMPVIVDPNFNIPPGVINVIYEDAGSELSVYYGSGEADVDSDVVVLDPELPSSQVTELFAPNWMNVVSQTPRVTADGNHVVDVTIEVEDVPGANRYEVRVTKL